MKDNQLYLIICILLSTYLVNAEISFINPTPQDGTFTFNKNILINTSISENLNEVKFNWNGINYPIYDNSLILFYNLNRNSFIGENDTYIIDLSLKKNNGRAYNTTPIDGKYWGGYYFDKDLGNNGVYIRPSGKYNILNKTIAAWVKRDSKNHWSQIAGKCSDWYFAIDSANKLMLSTLNMTGKHKKCLSPMTITDNNWHFVAVTTEINGKNVNATLYLDDKINGCFRADGIKTASQVIQFGSFVTKCSTLINGGVFNGSIDEVMIWNRTLSPSEIQELYFNNLYKYNQSQWYLTTNKGKNATAGLNDGTYFYLVSIKNNSDLLSTETRNITINDTIEQICDDILDNDNDGFIDCNDSDCQNNAICKPASCINNFEINFSTFLGGDNFEHVRDIAVDNQGYIYLTGGTESPNFPVTAGSYQTVHNPGTPESNSVDHFDIFITKLDPSGKIVCSTFVGGPNYERGYGIEVDNQGFVYVGGRAGDGAPITNGVFQPNFLWGSGSPSFYGKQSGYVLKMTNDCSQLVWASYFGGGDDSSHSVRDIVLDSNGSIFVGSSSTNGNFPFSSSFVNTKNIGKDGVVSKISNDGTSVLWARYLGGSGIEYGEVSIITDSSGNPVYLTMTESDNIPTTGFDKTYGGAIDHYVAKLSNNGNLIWDSYLGGAGQESLETHQLVVDNNGNVFVGAGTSSSDYFSEYGISGYDTTYNGKIIINYPGDAVVSKIANDGSRLLAGTFIGGSDGDFIEGLSIDSNGNIYATGGTYSTNFPVTSNALQLTKKGDLEAFFIKLSSDLSKLEYSTFYGGINKENGRTSTVDNKDNFYMGGEARGVGLPLINAIDSIYNGTVEAWIAKIDKN